MPGPGSWYLISLSEGWRTTWRILGRCCFRIGRWAVLGEAPPPILQHTSIESPYYLEGNLESALRRNLQRFRLHQRFLPFVIKEKERPGAETKSREKSRERWKRRLRSRKNKRVRGKWKIIKETEREEKRDWDGTRTRGCEQDTRAIPPPNKKQIFIRLASSLPFLFLFLACIARRGQRPLRILVWRAPARFSRLSLPTFLLPFFCSFLLPLWSSLSCHQRRSMLQHVTLFSQTSSSQWRHLPKKATSRANNLLWIVSSLLYDCTFEWVAIALLSRTVYSAPFQKFTVQHFFHFLRAGGRFW